MKAHSSLRSFLLISGSSLLAANSVHAASGTWNANLAGNWSDTTKWSGGTVADGADFTATFGDFISADRIVTLDSARTLGGISALDATHNYTISGANALTFDVTTGVSVVNHSVAGRLLTVNVPVTFNDGLEKTGAGGVTFGGPITLAAAQTWTNNSTGALTTGSGTNLINNGGYQLTVDGSGVTNFGSVGLAPVALTGSGALVKNGTGRLNIGGINTGFTGTVTVNGGVLHVYNDANALNTGNVTLNGGTLSFYWGVNYNRTLGTGTNQIQILGGESGLSGSGTTGPVINLGTTIVWGASGEGAATGYFNPSKFVLGDAGTGNSAATTFSSGINLNGATRTILVPAGTSAGLNRTTISGAISNTVGTAGFTKEGGGVLTLSNASSSWNGSTTVSGGIMDFGGISQANISGGSGRNISVAAGAAVRFNALSNVILNRLVETGSEITVMTGTTSNNLDFSSSTGANLSNAFLGSWSGNGAKAEYSGTLTPASDNYRLGGTLSAGLLGIVGTNKLTGSQGLIVGGTGGNSIRVNLAGAQNFTGDTVISTGAKLTIGNNLALQNSALNVGSAGGNFSLAAGTNAGRITGETASASPTFGGLKGSRNLLTVFSATAGNNETNLASSAVTGFTLNPGAGKHHVYTGVIANFATGTTLTITGSGTQEFTNAHTYTGATAINGGTLAITGTGSINGTSGVTINGGTLRYNSSTALNKTVTFTTGTLAGTNWTGTLSGLTVGAGDIISPGNSPGMATTVAQTWAAAGTYLWEINSATGTAGADPGWDTLMGTGTLDITAIDGAEFNIALKSLTLSNAAGLVANFNQASNYIWLIADFNSINGFDAAAFNLDTSAFSNPFTGTFGISQGGGFLPGDNTQIYLTYTAVPEPRAALLGGLGLLLIVRRRR
jgi:autotransporter-associated beta strand protein